MRISSKGRYALAAVTHIARNERRDTNISLNEVSEALGISKLYLEQVFSQLKRANLLSSERGSRGGYRFLIPPTKLTVWQVLNSVENSLTDAIDPTVEENAPDIEMAMVEFVFNPLCETIRTKLESITVQMLLDFADKQLEAQSYMMNL
jgi:Rrf2 family protein